MNPMLRKPTTIWIEKNPAPIWQCRVLNFILRAIPPFGGGVKSTLIVLDLARTIRQ